MWTDGQKDMTKLIDAFRIFAALHEKPHKSWYSLIVCVNLLVKLYRE